MREEVERRSQVIDVVGEILPVGEMVVRIELIPRDIRQGHRRTDERSDVDGLKLRFTREYLEIKSVSSNLKTRHRITHKPEKHLSKYNHVPEKRIQYLSC